MFSRYLIKVDKGEMLKIYFLHIYQENFINVYKGVIKVDKGEYLDYMLSILICVLLLLSVFFQENYLYI